MCGQRDGLVRHSLAECNCGARILLALSIILPLMVRAQDATPEKPTDNSAFGLLNPLPLDQMRAFATDRPTKSDTPYTVDAGHFQFEMDAVNWNYDRNSRNKTTSSNLLILDPALKAGISQDMDIELDVVPVTLTRFNDRNDGARISAAGFGDLIGRLKINLIGNQGGDAVLAMVPYVKAPTACRSCGNDHWEGGATLPFILILPNDWTLNLTNEADLQENADPRGMHMNYQSLINLSHPLFDDSLTAYAELWTAVSRDRGMQRQYSADFALAWLAAANFQLDVGVNFGLNSATSGLQAYCGLSQRF
jgi:hypothetical protein